MLNINKALRIEEYMPPSRAKTNRGAFKIYIFKCLTCPNEVKTNLRYSVKHSGLCKSCSARILIKQAVTKITLQPFQSQFNRLCDSANRRGIKNQLTFKDFLEFTKEVLCHYCNSKIVRNFRSATYYLDRKNNAIGYEKLNLVTCCNKCNKGKREIFTYEEWYGMTEYFRKKNVI